MYILYNPWVCVALTTQGLVFVTPGYQGQPPNLSVPLPGYLVPAAATPAAPLELLRLFFRARAWAQMACWTREVLRIALRTTLGGWRKPGERMGKVGFFGWVAWGTSMNISY